MPTDRWINAVMLDVVRITERFDYYRWLIPRLAGWGVNMLLWHFTDDEGCALKLRSRPELASRYALSRDETEQLIRLASDHGIEVVPEVESLGHTRYITGIDKYAHLFEGSETRFNALCPSHPESLEILRDVLTETADVFPSPWMHVGLDEVQFGPCERCAERGAAEWRLFADHVRAVHEIVTGLGKRVVLWGDHLVNDGRILRRVPDDCIVAHWDYFTEHPVRRDNRALLDAGREVLCCPSSARVFTMVVPDETNLANLREFAEIAHEHRRSPGEGRVLGLVNTVWCPERQLGGSTHYAACLAAALFEDPDADEQAVAERFVRDSYGLRRPAKVATALRELHRVAPGRKRLQKVLVGDPRRHEHTIRPGDVEDANERRTQIGKVLQALEGARDRVASGGAEFDMWIAAARILDELLGRFEMWQNVVILDEVRRQAARRGDAADAKGMAADTAAVLREAERQARGSAELAEHDWRRVRHADDPRRLGREGAIRKPWALPGLLLRTAETLRHTAERAEEVARTGKGSLRLPPNLVTIEADQRAF